MIDRPEKFGAAGRRPRGSLLPQGAVSTGDAPPILFLFLTKRECAAPGGREKIAFGRNFARACKVAVRGAAYRCLLRFCLAFGHARVFCDFCDCRPVPDGADLVGVQNRIWPASLSARSASLRAPQAVVAARAFGRTPSSARILPSWIR